MTNVPDKPPTPGSDAQYVCRESACTEFQPIGARVPLHAVAGPNGGPPLLFLHGLGRRWQTFVPLLSAVSTHAHFVAFDFRGHGRSGRASGQYRVIDYVDDALAVLRTLETPAVLYGHSLGAFVAAAAAVAEPDRVRAVIAEEPPGPGLLGRLHETQYQAMFSAMQRLAGSSRPVSVVARQFAETRLPATDGGEVRLADVRDAVSLRFSARCLADIDPEIFSPILEGRWLDGFDLQTIWKNVRCPVLLLRGDESCGGLLPQQEAEAICGLLADCTSISLPKAGHVCHWSATETTLRLVQGFVESL